jgi:hypothetical protein
MWEEGNLQVNGEPPEDNSAQPLDGGVKAKKKMVEDLKAQWNLLWSERFNDRVRAEGVSVADYATLRVERGTVIHATRDFKALNFKEIVEFNMKGDADRFIQPSSSEGGWSKFVKTEITNRTPRTIKRALTYVPKKRRAQQPKKGGRGWLHAT